VVAVAHWSIPSFVEGLGASVWWRSPACRGRGPELASCTIPGPAPPLSVLGAPSAVLVQLMVRVNVALTVVGVFISDLALALLDPRIRLSGGVTR